MISNRFVVIPTRKFASLVRKEDIVLGSASFPLLAPMTPPKMSRDNSLAVKNLIVSNFHVIN